MNANKADKLPPCAHVAGDTAHAKSIGSCDIGIRFKTVVAFNMGTRLCAHVLQPQREVIVLCRGVQLLFIIIIMLPIKP
jgi:hypothetical protein